MIKKIVALIKKYQREHALIMPRCSGKSTISQRFSDDRSIIMIDIDHMVHERLNAEDRDRLQNYENAQNWFEWELLFRPTAARIYDEVKRNFPERKIVILSSDDELPAILGIPAYNVKCFIPTEELSRNILRRVDEAHQAAVTVSRTDIIRNVSKLRIFNSFEALYTQLQDWLNIRQRI